MSELRLQRSEQVLVLPEHLQELFDALHKRGYLTIGPTWQENAIVYQEINSVSELPVGWTDQQESATYRLKPRDDKAFFGYTVSPQSWKSYLHPATLRLLEAHHPDNKLELVKPAEEIPKSAFIGVRACELHAIQIQDKIFLQGKYIDPAYKARRETLFIVAVNCSQAGGTCFCASMQTGPKVEAGFDLALTEVLEDTAHYFVVETGSEAGAEVLAEVTHQAAQPAQIEAAEQVVQATTQQMGRQLDTDHLKEILYRNYEHPQWEAVANRCLTCGNCTLVCPTCFCTHIEHTTDLSGEQATTWRKWDTCFNVDFSYIKGGTIRPSVSSRYRQWLTHKLATWQDQFGTTGCVGCGRCITWCPVGIDITAEAQAIRETDYRKGKE